jgi:drug/metabolite transporter (DMT)-like permease
VSEHPPERPLRGILMLFAAVLCFVGMDTLIKAATATLPAVEILWARFIVHMITVSVAVRISGRRLPPVSRKPWVQAGRSLLLAACNLTFTAAIAFIPLVEATAINFLSPLLVLLLAGAWLGESIGWRRWAAVGAGLLGVLIILRPGLGVSHPAAFLVVVTAALFAVYSVLTRWLARHDDALTTIWHTGFAGTIATSLVVPFVWVTPDWWGVASLLLLGLLGSLGHYLLILAYSAAPASTLAPWGYSQLIWAALFGWLAFGDVPDAATLVGGLVIVAGGFLSIAEGRRSAAATRETRP